MKLTEHTLPATAPREGQPPLLVLFFHGYGSSGAGTARDLAEMLAPKLPEAKIICPDGPLTPFHDDMGNPRFSWFAVEDMLDAPDGAVSAARARAVAPEINSWIDDVLAREGVSEDRVIIAGFSQGATMAYYAALLRDRPVAGVFSLSGGGLDQLTAPASKPPVGLAAGQFEAQEYSGVPQAQKAQVLLQKQGFKTDCVIVPDQGHAITPAAMDLVTGMAHMLVLSAPAPEKRPAPPVPSPKPGRNAFRP
jgi:phospholipase/carboxylesterase